MSFGARLKELREAKGLTQPQLESVAQLGKGSVANLEQDKRSPAWETVLALAKALNVEIGEFAKESAAQEVKTGRGRPKKQG